MKKDNNIISFVEDNNLDKSDRTNHLNFLSGAMFSKVDTYFYSIVHRDCFKKTDQYMELEKLIFKIQMCLGNTQNVTGMEATDIYARELETTIVFIKSIIDSFQDMTKKVKSIISNNLKVDDRYKHLLYMQLTYWAEQVPYYIVSFLDILAKYLFITLFNHCSEVNKNTSSNRRRYFIDFIDIFVKDKYGNPTASETKGQIRNPQLSNFFIKHLSLILDTHKIRHFLVHAGRLSINFYSEGSQIFYSSGPLSRPQHPDSWFDNRYIENIACSFYSFFQDLIITLIQVFKEHITLKKQH